MTLPIWHPPSRTLPSDKYRGEPTKDGIHMAVGSALSEWEHLETFLAQIFGHLAESHSIAPQRAYGTILSAQGRRAALDAATEEFFRSRPHNPIQSELENLFEQYAKASTYRANIAHGICYSYNFLDPKNPHNWGWFLCPPVYSTRKTGLDFFSSTYFYKINDISHCEKRFDTLRNEAIRLSNTIATTYPLP